MDTQRFDALTRGLGARATRRSALRWIGAMALGSIGLARQAAARAQAEPEPGTYGDPCEIFEGSCQAPFTCFEAVCDLPRGCVGAGQPCVADFPCCADEGLACIEGVCAVETETSLPSAGVGIPNDTGRVAGLALAGAAVLVAGKLIRDNERDPEL